jgi:hypothetical protein
MWPPRRSQSQGPLRMSIYAKRTGEIGCMQNRRCPQGLSPPCRPTLIHTSRPGGPPPIKSKSPSPHCFQLVLFLLIVRKINSNMPTVWTDCHLNPILLTLQRFRRRTMISVRVAGVSAVHSECRRPDLCFYAHPSPFRQYARAILPYKFRSSFEALC